MDGPINLLDYLKSKTQLDVDSLDSEGKRPLAVVQLARLSITYPPVSLVSRELGPFVDCTSNQMDAYNELLKPNHAALIKKSAALAGEIGREYPEVTREELAFEISVSKLSSCV
ncbi:MAG: hypothetical protein Q9181_000570 [Wetmoreana brouardii]